MLLRFLTANDLATMSEEIVATFDEVDVQNVLNNVTPIVDCDLLIEIATLKVADPINNPSGNWSDFNKNHKLWYRLQKYPTYSAYKLLCKDLIAEKPVVSDYPNLDD